MDQFRDTNQVRPRQLVALAAAWDLASSVAEDVDDRFSERERRLARGVTYLLAEAFNPEVTRGEMPSEYRAAREAFRKVRKEEVT